MRLECEVAGVEHVDFGFRVVTLVGSRPGSDKYLVILAPNHECWWTVFAEVSLPRRVEWNIGAVIVEKVELDLGIAWSIHAGLIVRPAVRTDERHIFSA